ncbi:unnamed protein product [Brassica oleracea]
MAGSEVLIRGRVHTYRPQSSKVFVILRQSGCTVQCVAEQSNVGVNMIKYLKQLSYESFVDVIGVVVVPKDPVKGTTQKVEIQVRKVYYVNRALARLPLGVEDAARSEADILKNLFRLELQLFVSIRIHWPQLHKQMAICGDLRHVFVVGPVFRAEDSFTHRHLCEFVGLDAEMEIYKDYSEIMDLVDELFVFMFTELNEKCKKELEAVGKQYPFEPLKEAGVEVDPLGDLNTESERKLGQLVLEKYKTEFYILHRFPTAVRPFYTMPCADNPLYSNSFDVFIRGMSYFFFKRLQTNKCFKQVRSASTRWIRSFGLERVVMLFCAQNNIRKTSLLPRDPQRLSP